MANAATNFIRELITRVPTKSNECVVEVKSDLEKAVHRNRCAVLRLAQTVKEVLSDKDKYLSER